MKRSETIGKIADALSKAQAEFPSIPKNKTAVVRSEKANYSYSYADLADVIGAVSPVLGRHGISVVQSVRTDGPKVTVTTLLAHVSGEWIETDELTLVAESAQPQKLGSATTYARRYSLGAGLNVAPEADDDANGAQGQSAETKRKGKSNDEARAAVQKATNGQPSVIDAYKQEALKEATQLRGNDVAAKLWLNAIREDPKAARAWTIEDCEKVKAAMALLRAKANNDRAGANHS